MNKNFHLFVLRSFDIHHCVYFVSYKSWIDHCSTCPPWIDMGRYCLSHSSWPRRGRKRSTDSNCGTRFICSDGVVWSVHGTCIPHWSDRVSWSGSVFLASFHSAKKKDNAPVFVVRLLSTSLILLLLSFLYYLKGISLAMKMYLFRIAYSHFHHGYKEYSIHRRYSPAKLIGTDKIVVTWSGDLILSGETQVGEWYNHFYCCLIFPFSKQTLRMTDHRVIIYHEFSWS